MEKKLSLQCLGTQHFDEILSLTKLLNPGLDKKTLTNRLEAMLQSSNYKCFGLIEEGTLIGLSGCWVTVRLYSGKQLELDNVIISNKLQSKGYGKHFLELIQEWALENRCETVELKSYIENYRSHKFYFNQGFKILGFHFQKQIKN